MGEGRTGFLRKQWKQEGILLLVARLIVGAVFIYVSIDKILHPAAFATAVYNYQILPGFLLNPTAIVLPWLELILGLFLVIGLFREGSVCIAMVLMLVFLGAWISIVVVSVRARMTRTTVPWYGVCDEGRPFPDPAIPFLLFAMLYPMMINLRVAEDLLVKPTMLSK